MRAAESERKVSSQQPACTVWARNCMINWCRWSHNGVQSASYCQAHSEALKCNEWAGQFLSAALIEQRHTKRSAATRNSGRAARHDASCCIWNLNSRHPLPLAAASTVFCFFSFLQCALIESLRCLHAVVFTDKCSHIAGNFFINPD